jgi:hypothetical protein
MVSWDGAPIPSSAALSDGSKDWNAVATAAASAWPGPPNITYLVPSSGLGVTPGFNANGNYNNVFWGATVYGEAWSAAGGDTVAITLYSYTGNQRTEADVIFNDNAGIQWDSSRCTKSAMFSASTIPLRPIPCRRSRRS